MIRNYLTVQNTITCRILLHDDTEDSLLLEGGVQGEDPHQEEVASNATNQNRLRL